MIEFKNVCKSFGRTRALKGISFKVENGDILGFLGPNGAGKSTALNILTGYLSASSGEAYVDGISIFENPLEAKKRIGFLPELPPLYPDMKVSEYLNFVYDLKGCKLPRKEHIRKISDVVRIAEVQNRLIKNLSKGYRQRVGIAQALVGDPKVLVFDEPTVGLDPRQVREIRSLVKFLGSEHTIIISSHVLPEVRQMCSRVVVINEGLIAADEPIEDLAEAVEGTRKFAAKICGPEAEVLKLLGTIPAVKRAEAAGSADAGSLRYIIESDERIDARKALFLVLASKGYPLIGLEGVEMSLEDVFVRLISQREKKGGGKRERRAL